MTLSSPGQAYADVLVYEAGDTGAPGWRGPAVYPYKPSNNFGEAGQILYRKLAQRTGLPVADTDTRADWASDPDDLIDGRKAQYPGWDLERFFVPHVVTEAATLGVFLAPDNAFAALKTLLEEVRRSIRFEGYTFENARLGETIAARARAGVQVEMILEGSPPGGISDQQRWVVQQIAGAGGKIYYFRSNSALGIHDRYAYQHGKFWVLDGDTALVGSENLNTEAFPDDPKTDGTFGRRGVYLVTDAPSVVAELNAVMDADIAPGITPGRLGLERSRSDPGRAAGRLHAILRFRRQLLSRAEAGSRCSPKAPSRSNSSTRPSRRCAIRIACWDWSPGPAPATRSWWSSFMKTSTGAQRPAT